MEQVLQVLNEVSALCNGTPIYIRKEKNMRLRTFDYVSCKKNILNIKFSFNYMNISKLMAT